MLEIFSQGREPEVQGDGKAKLKVHVFLNVGHQRGCKVVIPGTSVKINVFFLRFTIFIHSLYRCQTDISDIMNLQYRVGFSDSRVPPQQVKTRSASYLTHGGEGIGGMPYTDGRRTGGGGAAPAGERCFH